MTLNPIMESNLINFTRYQIYDRYNRVNASNKWFFDKNKINENIKIFLINENG